MLAVAPHLQLSIFSVSAKAQKGGWNFPRTHRFSQVLQLLSEPTAIVWKCYSVTDFPELLLPLCTFRLSLCSSFSAFCHQYADLKHTNVRLSKHSLAALGSFRQPFWFSDRAEIFDCFAMDNVLNMTPPGRFDRFKSFWSHFFFFF